MTDPWFTEIQLQKVYKMSPGEAYCTRCLAEGYNLTQICEVSGQSYSTIRTLAVRGRDKMKKNAKTMQFVLLKGNKDIEGVMVKQNAINVLARFYGKVYKTKVFVGDHSIVIADVLAEIPGDPQWMNENVFRKADIYGTTNDKEAEERADRLYKAYLDLDKGGDHLGVAVLRYMLDKMMIKYDVIEW